MRPGLRMGCQRAAALLLPVLLGIFIVTLLVRPLVVLYRDRGARIELLEKQRLGYQAAAQDHTALLQQLESLQRDPLIASFHLRNAVPTLATAELQQHIQKTVERLGGRLVSMQAIEAGTSCSQGMACVRIRLRGDIDSLRKVLFELESGRPLITLDNVFMRAIGPGRSAGSAAGEVLDIGFDAAGYLPGWLA